MNYFSKYSEFVEEFSELLPDATRTSIDTYFNLLINNALPRGYIGEAPEETLWLRHILDSLMVLQNKEIARLFHSAGSVVDLGSGAGLPGLLLAIVFPDTSFYLVETMQKRCVFLNEAIEILGLKNVNIINKRVEDVSKNDVSKDGPRLVLFRAFLKPLVSLELSLNILKQNSKVLYWRSQRFDISDKHLQVEIEKRLQNLGFQISSFSKLHCPGELGTRGYYLFDFSGKAARGYPRKWAIIKNDSLCNKVT